MRFNENAHITAPESSLQRQRIHALIEQVAGSANANLDLSTDDILNLTRSRHVAIENKGKSGVNDA